MQIDKVKYIEVSAGVRYWEDAELNGEDDVDGKIPGRNGDVWEIKIDLDTGKILDWPSENEAKIHYKVCDAGLYWLLDNSFKRILKQQDCYVPTQILCVGSNGHGDYIIFNINKDGFIEGWKKPYINEEDWEQV